MRCEKIKKIILTDYVDRKLNGAALLEIESHFNSCPECRKLAEEARYASDLFKVAPRNEAPPEVWHSIRKRISAKPMKMRLAETIRERLIFPLPYLRPAFIIAAAAVLVLFAITVVHFIPGNGYLHNGGEQDDIFLVSSVNGDNEEAGFGTAAEEYFL